MPAHVVAIVGCGPKGFYCLERLLAEFNACPLSLPLHIHCFNHSAHFAASPVYDPDQPEYILANINAKEIDLWDVSSPVIVSEKGPSFLPWYRENFDVPPAFTEEDYPPRSAIGHYLIEGFHRVLQDVPENVEVFCHVANVVDIQSHQKAYRVKSLTREQQHYVITADKVLLATGHSRLKPSVQDKAYQKFVDQNPKAHFIPFVYPVVDVLQAVNLGNTVAMKGMGLTFIDAILELTEGRGGEFYRKEDGTLFYRASGQEPRAIFPFCRTGLPILPKPYKEAKLPPFTFLTPQALSALQQKISDGKLSLEQDVWPLVELEMQLSYYRLEMKSSEVRLKLLACDNDSQAFLQVIDNYLKAYPEQERFNYWHILDPIGDRIFQSGKEFTDFIDQHLQQAIVQAYQGPTQCGIKAATDIWYQVRKLLGSVMQFGGFTPEAHRRLIEYYCPKFKRVALGPPVINAEKMLALIRTGLLDFSVARNPKLTLNNGNQCFELYCPQTNHTVQVNTLIDCRYPSSNISQFASPLYQSLLSKGMIRPYQNKFLSSEESHYVPGAIDMTEHTQFVINQDGVINEDIAVIGIPTEGNLVGNFDLLRNSYTDIWAAQVMQQLRIRESSKAMVLKS